MPTGAGLLRDRAAVVVIAAGGLALLLLIALLASIGNPAPAALTAAAVIDTVVRAGLPAGLYVLGAVGLGRVLRPLLAGAAEPLALQAGLGVALMLSISHALGCLGLAAGTAGRIIATAVVLPGVALALHQVLAWRRSPERAPLRVSPIGLLAIPGVALLMVAACQPPGWLWGSEFGGYDVLSYHLQLPQEWLGRGRIEPLAHNVYSYLPGYVESAFLHVAVTMGAAPPHAGADGSRLWGFIEGDGTPLIAAQFLHAWLAVIAAWLIARCATTALRLSGFDDARYAPAGAFAGVLFLVTPWTIVTGSMAYNEMGVTALGAAAMLAAMSTGLTPAWRAAAAGFLVGVACGCKPTALLFVGLPVGVLLVGLAAPRDWWRLAAAGGALGLIALAPWLIRNAAAGGNPVFPYVTSVFGPAHWDQEQVERFRNATIFDGSLGDRLSLLVLKDPNDPAGARHRGMLHPQWGIFFPLCAAAAAAALSFRATRRMAALLGAGLGLQLLAWLFASHLQSRFLIPLALPACVLIGLAAAHARRFPWRADLLVMVALAGVQAVLALAIFSRQCIAAPGQEPRPNGLLAAGPGALSGAIYHTPEEAADAGALSPVVFLNLAAAGSGKLYLLGGATPLYFADPLEYHTTWDASPLGQAMRNAPDDPGAWTAALAERGCGRVLVDFPELDRLRRSGFLDPALTPERVRRWLETARPIKEWSAGRQVLFELNPRGAGGTP